MSKEIVATCLAISVAAVEYFQMVNFTWISHDKWASDNAEISAFIGAPIVLLMYYFRESTSKNASIIIIFGSGIIFLLSSVMSVYFSNIIQNIQRIEDQVIIRDAFWKISHFIMLLSCILFIGSFALSGRLVSEIKYRRNRS